ncbi:MAG: MBL fold metallo-hydrolase [Patescibacteria group bacterium]|nr:MBL fold metallo-hydrolase [Patescibacteria group bacterium]
MKRREFIKSLVVGTLSTIAYGQLLHPQTTDSHFTLWQLPPQTKTQMNGYVLLTKNGKLIVIDGGCEGDAPYLRGFLGALGNHVHAWFISHPHSDHVDALTAILKNPAGIRIDDLYGSLPAASWIEQHENDALKTIQALEEALKSAGHHVIELLPGQTFDFDGVSFEILAVKNPEITGNAINNQCAVWRVEDSKKSVLFLGDLGLEAGDKLLNGSYRDRLKSGYVQMAHHGQRGVSEAFYREINPKYCLWSTPRWLWENDSGGGKNSGPWETLNVRAWMEKLNIEKHYVSTDGLCRID